MDTTYRTAYVCVRDAFAGTLRETDYRYFFITMRNILHPKSTHVNLTIPQKDEYISKTRFFFSDGLIPKDTKSAFEELICKQIENLG